MFLLIAERNFPEQVIAMIDRLFDPCLVRFTTIFDIVQVIRHYQRQLFKSLMIRLGEYLSFVYSATMALRRWPRHSCFMFTKPNSSVAVLSI